jgi:hypothetical protein
MRAPAASTQSHTHLQQYFVHHLLKRHAAAAAAAARLQRGQQLVAGVAAAAPLQLLQRAAEHRDAALVALQGVAHRRLS